MGHFNSEMEGEGEFRERMDLADRRAAICKELKNIPLSAFRASDLPALAEIQGTTEMHGFFPRVEYMDLIETKIKTWKENRKKRGRQ